MKKDVTRNNTKYILYIYIFSKPKLMRQYNLAMDSIDIKDQMVQPYLFERK